MSDFPRIPVPTFTPVEVVSDAYDPAAVTFNAPLADLCERTEYLLAHLGVEERLSLVADDTLSAPAEGVRERRSVLTAPPAAIVFAVPDTFGTLLADGDRLFIQVVGADVGTVQIAGSNAGFLLGAHKSNFDTSGDVCVLRYDGSEWQVEAVGWSRPVEIVQKIVSASTTLVLPSDANGAVVWAVGGGGGGSGGHASGADGGGSTVYAGQAGAGGGAGESCTWTLFDVASLEVTIGGAGNAGSGDAFGAFTSQWSLPGPGGDTTVRAIGRSGVPPLGWPVYRARGGRAAGAISLDCTIGGVAVEVPDAAIVADYARVDGAGFTSAIRTALRRSVSMAPGSGSPACCASIGPTAGARPATVRGPDASIGGRLFQGADGGGSGGIPVPRFGEPTAFLAGQGRTGGGGGGGAGHVDAVGLPGSAAARAGCGGGGGAGGAAPATPGGFLNAGGDGGAGAAGLVAVYVWR